MAEILIVNEGNRRIDVKPPVYQIYIPQSRWRWGLAVNTGAIAAKGEYLLVTNSDIIPTFPLSPLLDHATSREYVGPSRVNVRLTKQQTSDLLANRPLTGTQHRHPMPQVCEGDLLILRREDFFRVNGADPEMTGWGGEDTDLCNRLRHVLAMKRYRPHITVLHLWHKALAAICTENNVLAKKKSQFWIRRPENKIWRLPMTDEKRLEFVAPGMTPVANATACTKLGELDTLTHDDYDVVMLSTLILHTATEVKKLLAAAFNAVKPGGKCVIQFTDIGKIAAGWKGSESDACWRAFGMNTTFKSFWTTETVALAMHQAGFQRAMPCSHYRNAPHGWMSTLVAFKPMSKPKLKTTKK